MHAWKTGVEANMKKIMKILNIVKGIAQTEKYGEKLTLHLLVLHDFIIKHEQYLVDTSHDNEIQKCSLANLDEAQ